MWWLAYSVAVIVGLVLFLVWPEFTDNDSRGGMP